MHFKLFLESQQLEALVASLEKEYPGLHLFASENNYRIHIHDIGLPKEMQNQGIGTKVIQAIQNYATSVGLPITLTPQANSGKKAKLLNFYRNLGFYPNKGRKIDYRLSSLTGGDWLWRPKA